MNHPHYETVAVVRGSSASLYMRHGKNLNEIIIIRSLQDRFTHVLIINEHKIILLFGVSTLARDYRRKPRLNDHVNAAADVGVISNSE